MAHAPRVVNRLYVLVARLEASGRSSALRRRIRGQDRRLDSALRRYSCSPSRSSCFALVVRRGAAQIVIGGIDVNLIYAIAIPIIPRVARWFAPRRFRSAPCRMSMRRARPATPTAASSSAHGAECRRALPHHVHRLHRARRSCSKLRSPSSASALPSRPPPGLDALGQRGGLLSRGAWMILFPGAAISLAGVRLQSVRRQFARLSRSALQDVKPSMLPSRPPKGGNFR